MAHLTILRPTAALTIVLAVCVIGLSARAIAESAQSQVVASLSLDWRSLQPGELLVVNATLPEGATDVRVTGLEQTATA